MRIGLRNILFGVCLPALTVSGCAIGSHVPFTQVSHQQAVAPEIARLIVHGNFCDVKVIGKDGDQIRIEAKVELDPLAALFTEKGRFEDHVKLDLGEDTLTVSDAHMDQIDRNDWGVSFTIHLPRRLSVSVDTRVGDVAVGSIDAEVAVKSSVGDLSVTGDRTTAISASTSMGDISIRGGRAAAIAASSNIGDVTITLTGLSEKADATAHRGNVRMTLAETDGDVNAITSVGDIILTLGASKSSGTTKPAGNTGDVKTTIESGCRNVQAQSNTGDITVTLGEAIGGGKVKISTRVGDVHLRTAPGSAASYKLSTRVGDVRLRKPIQVRDGQVQIKEKSVDIDAGVGPPLYELHTGRGNIIVE